jgi:L-threonylcarbamoyladenylate synthase
VVIKKPDPRSSDTTYNVLSAGGVAILLCDTIYGIVGISPQTDRRISAIKNRSVRKPFLSLIHDVSWLSRFTDLPLPSSLRECWPGRLTLIFPDKRGGTVGLRVPEDANLRDLLKRLNAPLNSTSVNLEGEPPLSRIGEITDRFEDQVDLIVDSGDVEGALPSTVLDITETPFRVIRQGAVDVSEIIQEDR